MIRKIALALCCALWANFVLAADMFVIEDIRVEGLQRISEGTVYNYLPLDAGDVLTAAHTRASIRELYRTGFFQDIQFDREGDILVIKVRERPAIASIDITGNKAIKEEDLRLIRYRPIGRRSIRSSGSGPTTTGTDQAVFQPGALRRERGCTRHRVGPKSCSDRHRH